MCINQIFELSMVLDTEDFQKVFSKAYNESGYLKELGDEYLDTSMVAKGIAVFYRDSQYKKKVRLLVNTSLLLDDVSDTDKLIHKLDKRIEGYFAHKYRLCDFDLSGVNYIVDICVRNRANVSAYLKVLRRVGKVKKFSPASFDGIDKKTSFCLEGNSNAIDFLLYDLEKTVVGRLKSADAERKEIQSAIDRTMGVLRAEVRLTKPKAIRAYTEAFDIADQIADLTKNRADIFMETFAQVVPFGCFYKKGRAIEIIWREVKDDVMRRKMTRLLVLIPEKKSIHMAQKAMNSRNIEKIMRAFSRINLSPVTLSKRHEVKHLENLYSYM